MKEDVRLNELSKDEMWDVARRIKSGITKEEFEVMWVKNCEASEQRDKTRGMH